MKRFISILLLLFFFLDGFSQPTNYLSRRTRERLISFMADSSMYVPRYNGTPSGVRVSENSAIDGQIAMDTTNNRFYIYSGGAWIRLAAYSELAAVGADGNYGNLQLNRNGAFKTASTDSLTYTTAGGLAVTNFINVTSGNSYKYNSVNVIRAVTAKDNFHFGNSGNLTATGVNLISIGTDALLSATTGSNNIAIGKEALTTNTTGQQNTGIGTRALKLNTTGRYNTAIGTDVLTANTTGWYNTAIGYNSMQSNTTGQFNTGVGKNTLGQNSTGNQSAAFGFDALGTATTGSFNTANGYDALYGLSTADSCTGVGSEAGMDITTGKANTIIGAGTGRGITTGSRNTVIGANVTGLSSSLTGAVILANGIGTKMLYFNSSQAMSFDGGSTFGTSGYVLKSNGNSAAPSWVTPASISPGIDDVLAVGQALTANRSINLSGNELSTNRGLRLDDGNGIFSLGDWNDVSNGNKFKIYNVDDSVILDNVAHNVTFKTYGVNWTSGGGFKVDTFNIDLSLGTYAMIYPGIYAVQNDGGGANNITFPDPNNWIGHTIVLMNGGNDNINYTSGTGGPEENVSNVGDGSILAGYTKIYMSMNSAGGGVRWILVSRFDGTVD